MKLVKLTIVNFRSYYGRKEFTFSDHLNLILGSNGDGKTTFFEAINWVLTPYDAPQRDNEKLPKEETLVSAKMFAELKSGEKGRVLVSLEVKNNEGHTRIAERTFNVVKQPNGDMSILERTHKAYKMVGMARKELSLSDLFERENVFPAVIKKYHIFKGEDKLNIFNDKTTLQSLIDMFAEIKDIDPFKQFANYASRTSQQALSGTKDKINKQNAKVAETQKEIISLNKKLELAESQLEEAKAAYEEANENLGAIESDYEAINKIAELEKQKAVLENQVANLSGHINEEYSFKLLDDLWILMGFAPVLKAFNLKMESLQSIKDNIEQDYKKKQEDEFVKSRVDKAKKEIEKINWNQSDIDKLKYMLHAHRCAYCGTEAPEGSLPFDFIKQRINDVLDLLSPKAEEKAPVFKRYFSAHNIENLREMGRVLAYGKNISSIGDEIESLFSANDERRGEIAKIQSKIDSISKQISKLYANSSSGENLKDYVTNHSIVNRWHEQKQNAAITMDRLKRQTIPLIKDEMSKKREEVAKSTKGTGQDSVFMLSEFFRIFANAIENTESEIYEEFLDRLSKEANVFLTRLNVDDFTGIIKIFLDSYDNLKIELQDRTGKVITNPNTSLLTTMHISILFAISELTKENRDAEYPLIFDAPTSSFDEGKDKSFYECLNSQVNKQCIVVTKSFLMKNNQGEFVIDEASLSHLNCKKYRIKKLSDFDKLDITTIDTQVEEIN